MVYFIQRGQDGAIKIGTSTDPLERLRDLQVAHEVELRLLLTIEGDAIMEGMIHDVCIQHRLRGEWFGPHPFVLGLIEALLTLPQRRASDPITTDAERALLHLGLIRL
ncbi:MAG: GIY-YIG nuclease family protein [Candidatus Dormibacteria bacterium]